ncbi:HAD-superfamily hydrolase, subfamily IIA, partial [Syncephalis plumigaleata]
MDNMSKNQVDILKVIRNKKAFICDMDGVIYHEFVEWCKREGKNFLFLTNNSAVTPRELQMKMRRLGIDIPWNFLASQKPNGTCYVVGEPGLTSALYEEGFIMNDINPDFVVVGEGTNFNWEKMKKATQLIVQGAKLIATNLDANGPGEGGTLVPACGAFTSSLEVATGRKAFYCGKPNALMMRYAQRILGSTRQETCIIGDRMDTDVAAGISSEIDSILVLSGVAKEADLELFAYQPFAILE